MCGFDAAHSFMDESINGTAHGVRKSKVSDDQNTGIQQLALQKNQIFNGMCDDYGLFFWVTFCSSSLSEGIGSPFSTWLIKLKISERFLVCSSLIDRSIRLKA